MATAEVWSKAQGHIFTRDGFSLLAASTVGGGILLLDNGEDIIRIKLTKEEAQAVAGKIAPHLP